MMPLLIDLYLASLVISYSWTVNLNFDNYEGV